MTPLAFFVLHLGNMYQTIHEKVAVAGVYDQGKFLPKKIRWNNKKIEIDQITFAADRRDGGSRWRRYSVVCGPNLYRLDFSRDEEIWWLEEVWFEG